MSRRKGAMSVLNPRLPPKPGNLCGKAALGCLPSEAEMISIFARTRPGAAVPQGIKAVRMRTH